MEKIICISGTNRPGNYTLRALRIVADELQRRAMNPVILDACEMTLSFPGSPETEDAGRLRAAVREAAGVVIASPEYHGSFSAMTKLIIENLGFPSSLEQKPVALLGVASGRIGAIKTLEQLRSVCSHAGAIVMPGAVSIAGIRKVFDESGAIVDANAEKALRGAAASLVKFIEEFVHPRQVLEEMVRQDGPPWSATV